MMRSSYQPINCLKAPQDDFQAELGDQELGDQELGGQDGRESKRVVSTNVVYAMTSQVSAL